jgi:hypothetical protein
MGNTSGMQKDVINIQKELPSFLTRWLTECAAKPIFRNSTGRRTISAKRLSILLMFVFMCGLTMGQSALSANKVRCENYINISGATNLNDFALHQEVSADLICGIGDSRWIPVPEDHGFVIMIPVRNFNATNRFVYKDFLQLINVNEHPYIQIFMKESEFKTLFNGMTFYSLMIGVSVSGISKYYQIPCKVSNCKDNRIAISGSKKINLTDFNLSPPEKTLGLIKVHNELMINFEFSLAVDPETNLTQL